MAAQSRPDASASRIPTLRNTTLEAEPKCGVDDAFSLEAEPKCGVDDAFSPAQGAAPAPESADERGRAAARALGWLLPEGAIDAELIQRDICTHLRRSVEDVLAAGRGLVVLKALCGHGNFINRLKVMGVEQSVAIRFMKAARKFSNRSSTTVLKAAGNQTKLFELLILDDDQVEELELTGRTGELSVEDIAGMSVAQLRAAVRKARVEDTQVLDALSAERNGITLQDKCRDVATFADARPFKSKCLVDETFEGTAAESEDSKRCVDAPFDDLKTCGAARSDGLEGAGSKLAVDGKSCVDATFDMADADEEIESYALSIEVCLLLGDVETYWLGIQLADLRASVSAERFSQLFGSRFKMTEGRALETIRCVFELEGLGLDFEQRKRLAEVGVEKLAVLVKQPEAVLEALASGGTHNGHTLEALKAMTLARFEAEMRFPVGATVPGDEADHPLKTGDRIKSRLAERPGVVVKVYADGSAAVRWDDGTPQPAGLAHERMPRELLVWVAAGAGLDTRREYALVLAKLLLNRVEGDEVDGVIAALEGEVRTISEARPAPGLVAARYDAFSRFMMGGVK